MLRMHLLLAAALAGWLNLPSVLTAAEPDRQQPKRAAGLADPQDLKRQEAARAGAKLEPVTRADLAASYLRFEQALRSFPPPPKRRAELNRGFDRATLAFFAGNNAAAVRTIDELADSLSPTPPTLAGRLARALRVDFEPRVRIAGRVEAPLVRVRSRYLLDLAETSEVQLALVLRDPQRTEVLRVPFAAVAAGDAPVDLSIELAARAAALGPGTYRVELVDEKGATAAGQWAIVPESLDAVREANAARLAAITASTPQMVQALAACRARNALLADSPSTQSSAQFLVDPNELVPQVAAEIEALARGDDPYYRRLGDYWRSIATKRKELPLRIYAPPQAAVGEPLPLLIVLHGAGGDENMFFDGYGAGLIKQLAERHRLLVAAPLSYTFGSSPEYFDALVEALGYDYAIDPARIYVLGHSMGGGAAAGLAAARTQRLAGVVSMAGSRGATAGKPLPRMLLIAGGLDPIVSATAIAEGAAKAIEGGAPVTLRTLPDEGHTLLVAAALPEAIEWLVGGATAAP